MNTYKITLTRQLTALAPLLITIAAYAAYCYFNPSWPSFAALTGWIILAATAIIPTLAVHVEYLVKNSNLQLTISSEQLFFETKKQNVSYSFSSVRSLVRTSSFGMGSWYLFGDYRYYKITFNDGTEFFITSLLVPNIELNLVSKISLKEEKKLKFIAFI